MKGTISKKARAILNNREACDELMNYLLGDPKERSKPKEIVVGDKTYIVRSSSALEIEFK